MDHSIAKSSLVPWKDLVSLTRREALIENTITLPWLGASWISAGLGWWWMAVPCSFFFFLTALRQAHNGFHQALGLSPRLTQLSLHLLSGLMLGSMHAVRFHHLRHHKYLLGPGDYEGRCARLSALGAVLYGPVHVWNLHWLTLRLGSRREVRRMLTDLAVISTVAALALLTRWRVLCYHLAAMAVGELLSAFFAVWTVHHHLDEHEIARTQRSAWKNAITYQMFYHLEHHLYPAVPTCKLAELARRLDEAQPDLVKKQTF